jgi:hypothetical protein
VLPPVADVTIDYRAKGTYPILKLRSHLQNLRIRIGSASEEELGRDGIDGGVNRPVNFSVETNSFNCRHV